MTGKTWECTECGIMRCRISVEPSDKPEIIDLGVCLRNVSKPAAARYLELYNPAYSRAQKKLKVKDGVKR